MQGRFAYLKYQVDRYLEVWGDSGFEQLELLGFYWNDEALRKEEIKLNTGSIKLYYHGSFPGAFLASGLSGEQRLRTVYEDTYLFAKRKLDDTFHKGVGNDLSQFEDIALQVTHGKTVEFALPDTTDYTVRIVQSTLYGTFRLDKCGSGIYRAMKGYHGTDTIVLEIADGAGNKKTVTITVTVTKE